MSLRTRLTILATLLLGSAAARAQEAPQDDGQVPIPPYAEGAPIAVDGGGYCYVNGHPVDTRYEPGQAWDATPGRHVRAYPPIDLRLFSYYEGCYYFIGDPRDFGYTGQTWQYYGAHPIQEGYGAGWCFHVGGHYHLWQPWSPYFEVVGPWFYWRGPYDPYFWWYWPYYSFYYRSYYPRYYGGGRWMGGGGRSVTVAPAITRVPRPASWRGVPPGSARPSASGWRSSPGAAAPGAGGWRGSPGGPAPNPGGWRGSPGGPAPNPGGWRGSPGGPAPNPGGWRGSPGGPAPNPGGWRGSPGPVPNPGRAVGGPGGGNARPWQGPSAAPAPSSGGRPGGSWSAPRSGGGPSSWGGGSVSPVRSGGGFRGGGGASPVHGGGRRR